VVKIRHRLQMWILYFLLLHVCEHQR
jgi:hypothetical protein